MVRALAMGAGIAGCWTSHASAIAGRPRRFPGNAVHFGEDRWSSLGEVLYPMRAVALLEIFRLAVFAGEIARSEAEERQHGDPPGGANALELGRVGVAPHEIVLVLQDGERHRAAGVGNVERSSQAAFREVRGA